jgi:hypothetical protein
MLVFGLGSGRCGTTSLRLFLDLQRDVSVTHELNFTGIRQPLPWLVDYPLAQRMLEQVQQNPAPVRGDIGFYWLPYTGWLLDQFPDTRFLCMQRDRAGTVASYLRHTEGRNHWVGHDGTHWELDEIWDKAFPKYDIEDKRAAVERYWDEYYSSAEVLQQQHPDNFRIFSVDALNSSEGQADMLSFLGIEPGDMIFTPAFHLNISHGHQGAR